MNYLLPRTWSRCVQKHARSGWRGVDLVTNFVCCYRERDQARIPTRTVRRRSLSALFFTIRQHRPSDRGFLFRRAQPQ